MKIRTNLIACIAFSIVSLNTALAQNPVNKNENSMSIQSGAVNPVSMKDFEGFKQSIKPLIKQMSTKKIVGLGEGTHGTAEFYKLRFWITRILVEEKGFNQIAFENDFSDSWLLNKALASTTDLNALMRKHMLSIWQNEETKELLTWVKAYNSKHKKKVKIQGLDYVYLMPDIKLLDDLFSGAQNQALKEGLDKLRKPAAFQDENWEGMNKKEFKFDFESLSKSSHDGYIAVETLFALVEKSELSPMVKADVKLALLNLKQAFSPFYHMINKTEESSRDVNMAQTASLLLSGKEDKMIIWAHNGHVAKTGIYDNAVGGAGGELLKLFPGNYFVLGTGTANGTFAATTDSRDTYTNKMEPYQLQKPLENSWEELFVKIGTPAFYFQPTKFNSLNEIKQMRFVGYGKESGPKTYDKTNIADLFDAFLFISETHAPTSLK